VVVLLWKLFSTGSLCPFSAHHKCCNYFLWSFSLVHLVSSGVYFKVTTSSMVFLFFPKYCNFIAERIGIQITHLKPSIYFFYFMYTSNHPLIISVYFLWPHCKWSFYQAACCIVTESVLFSFLLSDFKRKHRNDGLEFWWEMVSGNIGWLLVSLLDNL